MQRFIASMILTFAAATAYAQSLALVGNTTATTSGPDSPATFRLNHFTFDLQGNTGINDWRGCEIAVDVIGTGHIWHASDQRIATTHPAGDPNTVCYVHNLQSPALANNAANRANTRMYDTFLTLPGGPYTIDPVFVSPGVPASDPALCPPTPPVLSTPTRIRGLDASGNEIPLFWNDSANFTLNNTVLGRITFEVPSTLGPVSTTGGPGRQVFATLRGRIYSSINPAGNPFSFDIYQAADCNRNSIPDSSDISGGFSLDANGNGIPDECEGTGPVITTQPGNVYHCGSTNATFTVTASGTGLSYVWRRYGIALADGPALGGGTISGSSTPTLTITGATAADAGQYSVQVQNLAGLAISQNAILSITSPIPVFFGSNAGNSTAEGLSLAAINASSGAFLRSVNTPGEVTFPNGVAVDASQNVYLVDSNTSTIAKYDWHNGAVLATYGPVASLVDPVGVAVYENGADAWLYVTGYTSNNVVRFNLDNPAVSSVYCDLSAADKTAPGAIIVKPTGELLVACEESNDVVEIATNGSISRTAASGCGLDLPSGLLLQPNGTLLVSSLRTNSVIRFNAAGDCIGDLVSSGAGGLSRPYGLWPTASGDLLVASNMTNQVLRYNASTGAYIGVFASGLDGPRYFAAAPICDSDCNGNGRPDTWDIALGSSSDANANGLPDECDCHTAPAITQQPVGHSGCTGIITLNTVASADAPVTYQWQRDGVPISDVDPNTNEGVGISGSRSATLQLIYPRPTDSAGYSVRIANACGTVTSNAVAVVIFEPPVITTGLADVSVCAGGSITLAPGITGTTPITYRWYHNDTYVTGGASLVVGGTSVEQGSYYVVASNPCGTVQSSTINVTLLQAPVFGQSPTSQTICAGYPVTFTAAVNGGPGGFSYQWFHNDQPIAGATDPSVYLYGTNPSFAGSYYVRATNSVTGCSTNSFPAALTVNRLLCDLNYDTNVNLTDLAILLSNFGVPSGADYEEGDINADGRIDLSDLATLLAYYGRFCL